MLPDLSVTRTSVCQLIPTGGAVFFSSTSCLLCMHSCRLCFVPLTHYVHDMSILDYFSISCKEVVTQICLTLVFFKGTFHAHLSTHCTTTRNTGTQLVTKKCSNVTHSKICNVVLLKGSISRSGSPKLYPIKTYCYNSLISTLWRYYVNGLSHFLSYVHQERI